MAAPKRRVLGVRAGPQPALTLGAVKYTRPFIARRPGPGVAGETAPGAGLIVLLLLPLLLIDRPSTRNGSGIRNRKRTLSSSVGVRGAWATFATAVPGCGWRGSINCHRLGKNALDTPCEKWYKVGLAVVGGEKPSCLVARTHADNRDKLATAATSMEALRRRGSTGRIEYRWLHGASRRGKISSWEEASG